MGVNARNVFLAGASGLVGSLVLRRLLENHKFTGTIFAPSRRALQVSDSRVVAPVVDLSPDQADAALDTLQRHVSEPLDVFISCLGTTIKVAGSRQAFIAVDRDLVLRLAQFAQVRGANHAILVSSAGASRQSGNFYLRVKGEVEDAMEKIGFRRLDLVQPGLLLGDRRQRRPVEAMAQSLAPLANVALVGRFRSYRSVAADTVAQAIANLAFSDQAGLATHTYDSIRSLASTG